MPTAALTPAPKAQFFAANGTPLVGGKLYSYVAGTTTPLATYINSAGITQNTNPVILDSRGEANVWLTSGVLYTLALYDANDALIWTVDNVSAINDGAFSGPVSGTTGTFSALLTAPNLTFSGTGGRIRGDFSNATIANRVAFQSTTVNGQTAVNAIPNGTSPTSFFLAANNSDVGNSSWCAISTTATEARVTSGIYGSGTYRPLVFYTNNAERMRIDIAGRVGINTTPSPWATPALEVASLALNGDGTNFAITNNAYFDGAWKYRTGSAPLSFQANSSAFLFYTAPSGTANAAISFTERFRIDGANSLVLAPSCNGIGYSGGSGGFVVQATSKSTAVTLNKATGYIETNNAALAANTTVVFQLNNSLIGQFDVVVLNTVGGIASPESYNVWAGVGVSGVAQICIRNITGGSRSEVLTLKFAIIKGSST